ncbi:hypothetical protein [Pseudomonas viridiflava]
MNRMAGVTEEYWGALNEDHRFKWKLFNRAITFAGALIVTKTGLNYVDWILAAVAALLPMLLIESQRSYRRFSSGLRKNIVRFFISLGTWCLVVLGVAYFVQVGLISTVNVFIAMVSSSQAVVINNISPLMLVSIFAVCGIVAMVRVFKDLGFWELTYHLPRRLLKKLLIYKVFKADCFALFAWFEITVVLVGFLYVNTAAEIFRLFVIMFDATVGR